MFGHYVHSRSDNPDRLRRDRRQRQLYYASGLLAELFDRAMVLENLWFLVAEKQPSDDEQVRPDVDAIEALTNFHEAARVFLRDCAEAQVRARRALLLAQSNGRFDEACREDEHVLAREGGPYPWAAEAEALEDLGGAA